MLVLERGLAFRTYGGETLPVAHMALNTGSEAALYGGGSRPRPPRNSRRLRRGRALVCNRQGPAGRCSASVLWMLKDKKEHEFKGGTHPVFTSHKGVMFRPAATHTLPHSKTKCPPYHGLSFYLIRPKQ